VVECQGAVPSGLRQRELELAIYENEADCFHGGLRSVTPTTLVSEVHPMSGRVPRFVIWGDVEQETVVFPPELLDAPSVMEGRPLAANSPLEKWLRLEMEGGVWLLHGAVKAALQKDPVHGSGEPADANHMSPPNVLTYDRPAELQKRMLFERSANAEELLAVLHNRIPRSLIELGKYEYTDAFGASHKRIAVKNVYGWTTPLLSDGLGDEGYQKALKLLAGSLLRVINVNDLPFDDRNSSLPVLDVAIIEDHNHGFRDHAPKECVNALARAGFRIWDMFSPFKKNNLWNAMQEHPAAIKDTAVVLHEDCLRTEGVKIRQEGSSERSLEQFSDHLKTRGNMLYDLRKCGDVIVRFSDGALHYSKATKTVTCYNCLGLPWRLSTPRQSGGHVAGMSSILTAALAKAIAWWYEEQDGETKCRHRAISYGVRLGIVLCELYRIRGYDRTMLPNREEIDALIRSGGWQKTPLSPFPKLFDEWAKHRSAQPPEVPKELENCKLCRVELNLDVQRSSRSMLRKHRLHRFEEFWTLPPVAATGAGRSRSETAFVNGPNEAAHRIIRFGLKETIKKLTEHLLVLEHTNAKPPGWVPPIDSAIPVAEFGKIESLFRDEIDAFDAIGTLVTDYLNDTARETPLCFAVFGAPGSGKGFTVREILSPTLEKGFKDSLKFNVAQFTHIRDLAVALHQVQDQVLSQRTPPLVFFDEFDTNFGTARWGWLQYFLSPMQDGEFKDGESVYRIGRAVFVFAGGISRTFASFASKEKDPQFVDAKGPDFISRLRGYVDIGGIDHPKRTAPAVILRRAIVLRQILERKRPEIIDSMSKKARIDDDVMDAFLLVPSYEHGVRSLEAVVEMSHITGTPRHFTMASLPDPQQLKMHIKDIKRFLQRRRKSQQK
jgi:hypothetical protein